jgi:hypothetical protein
MQLQEGAEHVCGVLRGWDPGLSPARVHVLSSYYHFVWHTLSVGWL